MRAHTTASPQGPALPPPGSDSAGSAGTTGFIETASSKIMSLTAVSTPGGCRPGAAGSGGAGHPDDAAAESLGVTRNRATRRTPPGNSCPSPKPIIQTRYSGEYHSHLTGKQMGGSRSRLSSVQTLDHRSLSPVLSVSAYTHSMALIDMS